LIAIRDFIARYGEKGYWVAKAILVAAARSDGSLGDFSIKDVKKALNELGITYNPSPILSKLEKEYGFIETTYKSSSQHWWKIVNRSALEEIISYFEENEGDYRLRLLKIQFYSLRPFELINKLASIIKRSGKVSEREKRFLLSLSFNILPLLVKFLENAEDSYEKELNREIILARKILRMAEDAILLASSGNFEANVINSELQKPLEDSLNSEF
jgi:hypothetical protein